MKHSRASHMYIKKSFHCRPLLHRQNFPLHLWDHLTHQAVLTLNLMRGSQINLNLSTWAQVYGNYDFNTTPIAPPGIKVLVHEKPENQTTWAPHAVEGWYVGPALQSYQCYQMWINDTCHEQNSRYTHLVSQHHPHPHGNNH